MKTTNSDIISFTLRAEEIFRQIIWPDGPECPSCRSHNYYKLSDGRYKCKDCGKIFSIKTGTILEGSKLSITIWMVALYLMLSDKGISSVKLADKLGITQKSAYYMMMRLRYLFSQDQVKLSGIIAADELYFGANFSRMKLSKQQRLIKLYKLPTKVHTGAEKAAVANLVNSRYKQPIFGMTDGEKIVLKTVSNPVRQSELVDIFLSHTDNPDITITDCSSLYDHWKDLTGCPIEYNNHSKRQFKTRSGFSSNAIEGYFAWIKRTTLYNQVHIKKAYLQLYLDEISFRYNYRDLPIIDKVKVALSKLNIRYDTQLLGRLNQEESRLLRNDDFFDPDKFFRENGDLITKVEIGGLSFRREDYL